MTNKQQVFADQYLIDYNATQAAIRAGYSFETARQQGYRLLVDEEISKYIKQKKQLISLRTQLDIEWSLNRYKDISDKCMQAEPVMIFVDGEWIESGEYKFDSSGAIKATDSIVKILGGFEKDNEQSRSIIESPTINVINSPNTLARSEKEVDESI